MTATKTVQKDKKKTSVPKTEAITASKVLPATLGTRRTVTGIVVSDKMQKTIIVKVDRRVRHGLYKKYVMKSCRYKAHDEVNTAKSGDLVLLVETRPLSKEKRWVLQSIVRKAGQLPEINV